MKKLTIIALVLAGCEPTMSESAQTHWADRIEQKQERRLRARMDAAECEVKTPFTEVGAGEYHSILTCQVARGGVKTAVKETVVFHTDGQQTQWKIR